MHTHRAYLTDIHTEPTAMRHGGKEERDYHLNQNSNAQPLDPEWCFSHSVTSFDDVAYMQQICFFAGLLMFCAVNSTWPFIAFNVGPSVLGISEKLRCLSVYVVFYTHAWLDL